MLIYKVTNLVNGKVYVGKTSRSLEERQAEHMYSVREGSFLYIHRALRKYGNDAFDWRVIDHGVDEADLNAKECWWIVFYDAADRRSGYNLTHGGEGVRPTEETRRRMSEVHKGKLPSDLTRRKWSEMRRGRGNPMWGRHFSEQTKKKMSEMRRGKQPRLGKHFSEESKKKMSDSHKGKRLPEEQKKKISEKSGRGMLGRHHSEETRKKISEARRRKILGRGSKEECPT